ncbi:peptidase S10 serine carboxypeptidase [Gigaspora rosea]|uniref:Carboxypeptidase n=1 Tax=Gigaspora rosea TaxID=44941 RepID=A0A397U628_9GLOM|nr:peptidase S10 serine carboxypeptidase [Gigaspora rosea]
MISSSKFKLRVLFFVLGVLILCNLVLAQGRHKLEKTLTHRAFPEHKIKLNEPKLCDKTVQQYSGYFDVNNTKHLFFWFFESRNKPQEDPIVLSLTGGPGCSSLISVFLEIGPCTINEKGDGTTPNSYSWTNYANMIFLDQPTNAGYSYGGDVSNTTAAAADIYVFLQIFFQQFPKYAKLDFHIAGESYAGHYIPALAAEIYNNNNNKIHSHINLESILIGNGFVNPLVQFKYYPDMACNSSYGSVLDNATCNKMRNDYPRCENFIKKCYESKNADDCSDATIHCSIEMIEPYLDAGKNLLDIRYPCNGTLCNPGLIAVENFGDRKDVKTELGVDPSLEYQICNIVGITFEFLHSGDMILPFHKLIPPLLENNIRVLIYAGDADFLCNWIGNEAWVKELQWSGKEGFNNAKVSPWVNKNTSKQAGEVRTFKGLTFLRIFEAGHMPPYDQPSSSLDFFSRWLFKEKLYIS